MSPLFIAFLAICLCVSSQNAEPEKNCEVVPGDWSECLDGKQQRPLTCVCGGLEEEMEICEEIAKPENVQDCETIEPVCKWRWTRWSACTKECDTGNTTRTQICMCEGDIGVANNSFCDEFLYYSDGVEVADCNTFGCDEVPAYNKLYWIAKADEGHWPMPDDTFACSLGYEVNTTSPKGKHYSTILRDDEPQNKPHPEWYYLAKEWIAAKLNVANGVRFSSENVDLVSKVGDLLEDCNGWTGKQLYNVYSAKEKLGRMNNNIGGLEHVDEQVAVLEKINGDSNDDLDSTRSLTLLLAIPAVAIILVLIVVGVVLYNKRRSRYLVVEKSEFESEDEDDGQHGKPIDQNQE